VRQAILRSKRWLPARDLVFVADSGFAVIDLLGAVCQHVCLITRLRLDANLFKPAPKRRRVSMAVRARGPDPVLVRVARVGPCDEEPGGRTL